MPFKSFDQTDNSNKFLPFFSNWIEDKTPGEKKKLEGKTFFVLKVRSHLPKGYFLDTTDFTVFIFKTHPLVSVMSKWRNGELTSDVPVVVINSKVKWGHQVGIDDDYKLTAHKVDSDWIFEDEGNS